MQLMEESLSSCVANTREERKKERSGEMAEEAEGKGKRERGVVYKTSVRTRRLLWDEKRFLTKKNKKKELLRNKYKLEGPRLSIETKALLLPEGRAGQGQMMKKNVKETKDHYPPGTKKTSRHFPIFHPVLAHLTHTYTKKKWRNTEPHTHTYAVA